MDLVSQTARTIQDERLVDSDGKVVVAVSGGPDSMALLHVLHQLSLTHHYQLIVAHVNHQFRIKESAREAEAVEQYAKELNIPFHGIAIDVPAHVRKFGGNPQAVARQLRYEYLHKVAEQTGATAIALAHHADDQVETVLMNLLRGASLSGLIGILMKRTEKNMELIRPFLRIPKERLLEYCESEKVPYFVDSSNSNRKYTRNRVRLDIIPQLLSINPKLPEAIDRLSDIVREEDHYLNEQTKEAAGRLIHCVGSSCSVSRKSWIAEPVALQRRLIKLILNYVAGDDYSSDYTKIESIRLMIANEAQPSFSLQIDTSVRMVRGYDHIEWFSGVADTSLKPEYAYVIENPGGDTWISEAQALLTTNIEYNSMNNNVVKESLPHNQFVAYFDVEHIKFPIIARSRRSGDRIELLGLKGTKKVKDMFIDLKISREWRDQVPLIVDREGHILWIPGIGRSVHGLIDRQTSEVLRMEVCLTSPHK